MLCVCVCVCVRVCVCVCALGVSKDDVHPTIGFYDGRNLSDFCCQCCLFESRLFLFGDILKW